MTSLSFVTSKFSLTELGLQYTCRGEVDKTESTAGLGFARHIFLPFFKKEKIINFHDHGGLHCNPSIWEAEEGGLLQA